jgi:putative phosphoesterase
VARRHSSGHLRAVHRSDRFLHHIARLIVIVGRKVGQAGTLVYVRIGVISDTHGLLRAEAEQRLAGVAHIVHAGDIGRPDVIAGLRRIAPVIAIRGNVDTGQWAERYPDTKMVRLGGRSIYVLHDIHELRLDPVSCGVDVVISGHSHRPRIDTIQGVLYLNPGSAGPRRFNLPVTLAILELTKGSLRPFIHHLGSASTDQY